MILSANTLNQKFTLATIIGFLTSSLVFLGLFLAFYQTELSDERAQAARDVNRLLQSSLENAMLKRDLEGLRFIVNRLGQQPNINRVMIINPKGQVRFSSHPEFINSSLNASISQSLIPSSNFIQDKKGKEVLRSVNPVNNKPQCKECHGSADEHPVNGILIVDYDASSIKQKVRNTTLILMGAGALIVIINLLGGWWFIHRYILKPVHTLSDASQAIANGQCETRVITKGNDELSILGNTFNLMASHLQDSMRSLKEEKTFLQALVDAIPDGLRIIDDHFNMILVNKAFLKQTGCPEKLWVGEKCYVATQGRDSPCPTDLKNCTLEEVRKKAKPFKVVRRQKRCDGSMLDVEIFAAPMTFIKEGKETKLMIESIRDLTQEVRFTHEQRLSELGHLAANVAHEIFNPLSSMKLAVNSITNESPQNTENMNNYIDIISKSMDQCIQMTDRLLRLSAVPSGKDELVDVCNAIKDVLGLVKWDAEQALINVVETFPDQPLRVFASESEIRMLILNLVQNAFHAMPSGGVLNIKGNIKDGQVIIRFEDTGVGISEEHLSKIFMPFFSRRADNVHGTGLGLPISQAIVESYGGKLEANTTLGKGSCFIITIPEASITRLKQ
ncbi:MAG: HAMP domain-containing protein [gamma proteobacterium symbiont of Bathyaustriella thionipta]|nr:HAMP domain-containing protein [gamma proteobacterium symbiont of Bathyaustriella thionipta]MCU7948505.1 HAMP domain-containing protein [gamma proteobacterium symbiont of Bathyaustriella thionipta]MCU7952729.1 HAMP domain-containing protein [gamma proteobacterium symbiont of Bathyaustriella thionipta]MCU7957248.1 HAMP domain-containing protein [gamma proteobacterium symbiont of Bathyaustriella thionipta]MCU7967364.1 HAMP domain-containing protein [gamma proteobacterium symbiont of Bathyaustr